MPVSAADMKYVSEVASHFRRSGSADADDVISDGALGLLKGVRLWDSRPDIRAHFRRDAFLKRVIRRKIIDELRTRNGRSRNDWHHQKFRDGMTRLDAVPDGHYESQIERWVGTDDEHLVEALDLLRPLEPREREIVWRTEVMGEPYAEVAEALGISESKVCQLRREALARLRDTDEPWEPSVVPLTPDPLTPDSPLTPRELEVLAHFANGYRGVAGVAEALQLSHHTVASHLKKIGPKIGARTREHAVAIALRSGLIE